MSVLRVMGTETEYGISVPGQPGANSMVTSSQIVTPTRRPPPPRPGVRAGTSRRKIRSGTREGST